MAILRLCSIPGCSKPVRARGWCNAHWIRWSRHGDPNKGRIMTGDALAFIKKAIAYTGGDCLLWPYARRSDGRGAISSGLAHRRVCEEVNGPPPSDLHEATHSCGNGHLGCITPRHLRWSTHHENMTEMVDHGRSPRGERQGNSKLTAEDVREIRRLSGRMLQREIAEMFGIAQSHVSLILRRHHWGWLD